jgi:hypothetical protein
LQKSKPAKIEPIPSLPVKEGYPGDNLSRSLWDKYRMSVAAKLKIPSAVMRVLHLEWLKAWRVLSQRKISNE